MAEDLASNLVAYKLQLQQVEASLAGDPDNEDLHKLQKDLLEVIELTADLLEQQVAPSASGTDSSKPEEAPAAVIHSWNIGDKCMAPYSDDGGCYPATIDEILEDGTCTVTFTEYGNTDVTQVALLKPAESTGSSENGDGASKPKTKKDIQAAQREYKKKKAEKKRLRQKQLEEEREQEKNKWLDFNSKVFSKTSKGKVKKSIFASPDQIKGKIGIGTCGQSGKPMTEFQHRDKWKKN